VVARVRSLSNLECVGETLRATLDDLAALAPDWLVKQISPDWFERYSHRVENYRLPKAESQRTALAQQIGADGLHLLQALESPDAPDPLKNEASVQLLRQVWQQYYDLSGGKAKWRAGPQASESAGIIRSPYDPEARTGKKREVTWLGYKVHLTETCALDGAEDAQARAMPQLIVEVQTTVANVQDVEMTATIQEDLAQHHLLPDEQIVDTGYVDADLLVSSQQNYGIKLLGPVLSDNSWQAKVGKGFDVAHFHLDWQNQQATCPQGQSSARWSRAGERMEIVFARCQSVLVVLYASIVPGPRRRVASCICVRKRLMRRFRHDDRNSRRRRFGSSMPNEQALKGHTHKPFGGWGCDELATMGWTRRICNIS